MLAGAGGSAVSLLWDVLYKGMPFSLRSIGPLKIMGMVAGLVLLNAGIVAGFALARRKRQVTDERHAPVPTNHPGFLLAGVILTISGIGGMLLSLFWDVLSRGRPFSAAAIGPFKLAGILAGGAILAAGALMFLFGRRKAPVREPGAMGPPLVRATAQEPVPFALPVAQATPPAAGTRPMEAIPVEEPAPPGEGPTRRYDA